MTDPHNQCQPNIVERLRSSEPLPACPFDRISPHYLTMPDDKPCPICGQENTTEGPDKCRGADTRIMSEAAYEIERLLAKVDELTALGLFLVNRLDEFDPGDFDAERDFHGHVAPALARFRGALALNSQHQSPPGESNVKP